MNDAIKATIQIMQAKPEDIKIRTSYNLSAINFTPQELSLEIKKHIPDFKITYQPDYRQQIADTWPDFINDSFARKDWNWQHEFDLKSMTTDIINNLKAQKATFSESM
jgi:nucleoside-diphosphate-sugar epimerase